MSAINGLKLHDAAFLFADGASYSEDGTLRAVASKMHVLAALSTVMVSSGRTIIMPYLAFMIERDAKDFDDLRDTIADRLPNYENALMDLFGEDTHSPTGGKSGFRLYFAGWSPRSDKIALFSISNSLHETNEAIDASRGFSAPGITDEENALGYGGPPRLTPDNMHNIALTTLELQRRHRWEPHDDCRVGGFVEMVTLRRDRIETRILKRWPEDKIGEKLQPLPMDWAQWRRDHSGAPQKNDTGAVSFSSSPANVTALNNRHQRRAAERGRR